MTPNEIEVLIHCHVCPQPHPRGEAMAVREALLRFESEGLIERRDGICYTTERGNAHIGQLCSLPLPARAWVNDRGEVIG